MACNIISLRCLFGDHCTLQSWLGWEYKPYVPKTVSINVYVKSAETPCALQGSGSSIWYDNGTMNMQVVDVSVGRTTM